MGSTCCKQGGCCCGCCCCCKSTTTTAELPVHKTKQDLFFEKYPKMHETFLKLKPEIPRNWNISRDMQTPIKDQGIFLGKANARIRTGYGIMLYDCGLYYIGVFHDNCRNGMGFMIDPNGSYYKGEWSQDEPCGYGQYKDGTLNWMYKGKWKNGKKAQLGQQIFPDGTYYIGSYENNLKHGMGKFNFDKNCYFKGSFEKDIAQGQKCVQKAEDYIYQGPFQDNDLHGAAKVVYLDDRGNPIETYIGEFYKGVKHGYGEYTWADGSTYKGEWKNGQIANRGVFIQG